jgi:YVTN family beta-propeller protein
MMAPGSNRVLHLWALVVGLLLACGPAGAERVRILQTNSGADTIDLIDPATLRIVGEIDGIPVNHGAAAAPDGSRLYFSSEAKQTLCVVDPASLEIVREIPLSGRPNNISIGKDGRFVYVGIMEPGGIDVVDTHALEKVKHIETGSRVHNTYVTPDGRYLVAGTFGGDFNLKVYDTSNLELAWALFPKRDGSTLDGVRPIAFETNPDGSTKRLFVQVSDLHGFAVVDFAAHAEARRITLPDIPAEQRDPGPFTRAPSHGIGVAPDGKTLWVASRVNSRVYAYSLPDLAVLGDVEVGSHPDWLTFTPDSRLVFVANGKSDDVSVIDVAKRKEIRRVKVGKSPKRNITAVLP